MIHSIHQKDFVKCRKMVNNLKREDLGMLHGLEKFKYYYFPRVVGIIPDHKSPITISKKDVIMSSQV